MREGVRMTDREGGREGREGREERGKKEEGGREEKEEQRGRKGEGESSICILILCSLHTQNVY